MKEEIINLKINQIDDFPNHPFKIKNDDEMERLKESIKENGILHPIIVRKKI